MRAALVAQILTGSRAAISRVLRGALSPDAPSRRSPMRAALIATMLAGPAAAALAAVDTPRTPADSHAAPHEEKPATVASADATHDGPLIAYAIELNKTESTSDVRGLHNATSALRAVTFELSRHPPPRGEDCAQTLGASRFAQQYAELASIQDQLGNFEAVIEANRSALACMPRVASYEASIASAYISLTHIAEARAAVERGYALDPEDRNVREVRARLDFIQERWADATARFRLQVLEEKSTGSQLADYERCYLWLAQRRAGVRNPEIPEATPLDSKEQEEARLKRWPNPILETLRGEMSEASLAQTIRDEASESARREWLTEALYYVGELRLAEGDAETARRHFASVINLRVLNFVEYGMARAELKKMRDRN